MNKLKAGIRFPAVRIRKTEYTNRAFAVILVKLSLYKDENIFLLMLVLGGVYLQAAAAGL